MKFLILGLLFVGLHAKASWVPSKTGLVCSAQNQGVIKGGSNPWPFGREMNFPWGGIQGVWQAATNGCSSLFLFKLVSESSNGERYVSIIQYDPVLCREVAYGVGYERNRVLHAVLSGPAGSFELTLHAFDERDVKAVGGVVMATATVPQAAVVVMRMRNIGPITTPKANFQLERLKKTPAMLCK